MNGGEVCGLFFHLNYFHAADSDSVHRKVKTSVARGGSLKSFSFSIPRRDVLLCPANKDPEMTSDVCLSNVSVASSGGQIPNDDV